MHRLAVTLSGFSLYNAGLPHFPRNFARDGLISGIFLRDAHVLSNQLEFCSHLQGKKFDAHTGEEPGKIFHEFPEFIMPNGLSTQYNACDTTALYLIAHEVYAKISGKNELAEKSKAQIILAKEYILSHLKDGLFMEDPAHVGTDAFALKVTFWKDSEVPMREEGKPCYPVVYPLAHIQNLRALKSAAFLLKEEEKLAPVIKEMQNALEKLFDNEKGCFYFAIDKVGPISALSSDSLHALFYLGKDDLPAEKIERIKSSSVALETHLGYRTLFSDHADSVADQYHASSVWPFEQAIIHAGAKKFGLKNIMEVSERIHSHLDSEPELFYLKNGIATKGGCDPQLWTLATKKYFQSPPDDLYV